MTEKSMPTLSGPSSSRRSGNSARGGPLPLFLVPFSCSCILSFYIPAYMTAGCPLVGDLRSSNLSALQFYFPSFSTESLSRLRSDDLHRRPSRTWTHTATSYVYNSRPEPDNYSGKRKPAAASSGSQLGDREEEGRPAEEDAAVVQRHPARLNQVVDLGVRDGRCIARRDVDWVSVESRLGRCGLEERAFCACALGLGILDGFEAVVDGHDDGQR